MNTRIEIHLATSASLGYVRYGHGPVHVMVLHDWLSDHCSYDAVIPCLDSHAFTYVFVDLRGYGLSITRAGTCTVEEITHDCFTLADHLGWTHLHILGHSMTGLITQRMAADAPQRITSAIAVCPVSAAGNRLSPEALAFFASACEDDDALRRLFRFVGASLGEEWVEAKVRQNRKTVSPVSRKKYLDMLVNADFVEDIRGLETPYLLVVGDNDPGLDASAMERTFLAWHPNAQLHVIANCGHYPMHACPAVFAGLIEGFLKRNSG